MVGKGNTKGKGKGIVKGRVKGNVKGKGKRIVEGNWAEEDLDTAEARFAVLAKVMHRMESSENADRAWRSRVLDTREHVSFLAQEKDAAEEARIQARVDSAVEAAIAKLTAPAV